LLQILGRSESLQTFQVQPAFLHDVEEMPALVGFAQQGGDVVEVIRFDLAQLGLAGAGKVPDQDQPAMQDVQISSLPRLNRFRS
jgi:hypothetical protein